MAKNIYGEMFDQLSVPARLEPENIARMLDEHMAANTKRSTITVSSSDNDIKKASPRRSHSAAYRAIMSVAACAVLVLGLMRYMGVDEPEVITEEPSAGNYASDYSDIHKTFQQYYVDDSDKQTLDSAIAEIEHAYNEAQGDQATVQIAEDPAVTEQTDATQLPVTDTQAPVTEPVAEDPVTVTDVEDVEEIEEEGIVLPDMSGFDLDHGIVMDGDRIFVRDGNDIRVLTSVNGIVSYNGAVEMLAQANENKELIEFYVVGNRLAAVYSVETAQPVADVEPSEEVVSDSVLDEIMGNAYAEVTENVIKHSVEVSVYEFIDGIPYQVYSYSQCGSFVEVEQTDGSVYVITDYNDYRLSPIVGVDDLDSYVPTYCVNGVKMFLEPSDILIPSRVTTTDYTVISGISVASPYVNVSVQALLGYEGRTVVTDGAVYIFGYEVANTSSTSVEKFKLTDGTVMHDGFEVIDGVALSGDGITYDGETIIISTLADTELGYVTTVRAYDESLEIISKVDFPAFLTKAQRDGSKIYLNGSDAAYAVDFEDPAAPVLIGITGEKDVSETLVEFEDGYVILTQTADGSLVLSKIIEDVNGDLSVCYDSIVFSGADVSSKALTNNDVLYVNGDLVGVPYGYFDGYDYCYTYALYRSVGNAFEFVGKFESHETDAAFEMGKAVEKDGVLYVFSEGRVYAMAAGSDALALISRADMIYSAYSGHNAW